MEYSKETPFLAAIKERYRLNKNGSDKQTYHLVLDIEESGIEYRVGDCVAVQPENDRSLVDKTLAAMQASGEELITVEKSGHTFSLRNYLTAHANISDFNKGLIKLVAERLGECEKGDYLRTLLLPEKRVFLKEYLESRELWDFLEENCEARLSPQEISSYLRPLLARFYSIASSPTVEKEEMHLTVALLEYSTNGKSRRGVTTSYLCHEAETFQKSIKIYPHATKDFLLPEDGSTPIIMVGPGTGIAPYRGFLQERIASGATGKNWLFFGERTRANDFFYEEFFLDLVERGKLRLDCAFSRDQSHKIYVQHKMAEAASDIWQWIEEGAVIYVCGDAKRMAKDVDETLRNIVSEQGGYSQEEAKLFLKDLRKEKRYLRDVY